MDLKLYIRAQWDRIGAVVLVALGGLALLLGWIGVSGTPLPSEQIPYVVSGGLAGLALIGVGATLWLSADLRDEWRKLKHLEDAVREASEIHTAQLTAVTPPTNGSKPRRRPVKAASARMSDEIA